MSSFAGVPTIEKKIEQKILNTKVASAKVAFDTVRKKGWAHRNRAIFAIAMAHRRPDIAAISDTLLNKATLDWKVRISTASHCDLILRFPSENRALSAEIPCDLLQLRFAILGARSFWG